MKDTDVYRALMFAADRHTDQRRKGSRAEPYVNHLIEVIWLLSEFAGVTDPILLSAAALHDVVEDTDTTLEELERDFGAEITRIVADVTDDKDLPKHERKRQQEIRVSVAVTDVKLLKLADHAGNVASLPDWNTWTGPAGLRSIVWVSERDLMPNTIAGPDGLELSGGLIMDKLYEKLSEAAASVRSRVSAESEIAVILGSGLGTLTEELKKSNVIPYKEIPHFPVSTVAGHAGRLVFGTLHDKRVMMMEGRPHFYEGYTMRQIGFPVFLMKFLGVKSLVITNACGGINTDFSPGTLMILSDFINLVLDNPLIGVNDDRIGPRFPDMTEPYNRKLIKLAEEVADGLGVSYTEGVYAGFQGPYYETAAEIRSIGRMGADAVGMSTVPETIAANYVGIECFAIACITNMATGIQMVKHSHERVLETARQASVDLSRWISALIGAMPVN